MRLVAIALSALLVVGVVAHAQEKDVVKKRTMNDRAWVEGKVVCIGCTLAAQHGVDAQCTLHAKHAQGFLTEDGKLWTFVDNTRGHRVITNSKLTGKDIKIYGWRFKNSQYIELWKYSLKKRDKWVAYDFCKT